MPEQAYYSLSTYFRRRWKRRVQKIPLDAGFSCPNRDGTLSRKGCLFCNARGSGSGLLEQGLDLAGQWRAWHSHYLRRLKDASFIAYLQSFSNTHGPVSKLREVLEEICTFPDLVGIALGTRPDCLDHEKLALLAACSKKAPDIGPNAQLKNSLLPDTLEIWLELGLQTANDAVLENVNRGHDFACFQSACRQAAEHGLLVCAHLIAGLPGENRQSFLDSVAAVNVLPVHGVKFHNLYVCQGSQLAGVWKQGGYQPLSRSAYLDWLCEALARLRSDIVVQRLTGDPAPGELLAPDWAAHKSSLLRDIRQSLAERNLWQGKLVDAPERPPHWFSPHTALPAGDAAQTCLQAARR